MVKVVKKKRKLKSEEPNVPGTVEKAATSTTATGHLVADKKAGDGAQGTEAKKKKKKRVGSGAATAATPRSDPPPDQSPKVAKKKKKRIVKRTSSAEAPQEDEAPQKRKKRKDHGLEASAGDGGSESKPARRSGKGHEAGAGTGPAKKTQTSESEPPPKKKRRKAVEEDEEEAAAAPSSKKQKKHADDGGTKQQKVPDERKVFVSGLAWSLDKATVQADFEECGEVERFDMPLNAEGKPSGNAFIYYKTDEGVKAALEFDGDEYHGRRLKVLLAKPQGHDGAQKKRDWSDKGDWKQSSKGSEESGKHQPRTVFVAGLPYNIEEQTIWDDFKECGDVVAVRMLKSDEGKFKGIAFVVYKDEAGVEEALKFDGDDYAGRTLRVARASAGRKDEDGGKGGKGGKGKGKGGKGGKGKGGKGGDKKGVCYKFPQGTCPFGDKCIFSHDQEK